MLIKIAKNWKDTTEFCRAPDLSRRDFLARSATAGILSILAPSFLLGHKAYGAAMSCPPSTLVPGGFGQVLAMDGCAPVPIFAPTMASAMNPTMAANYGVTGTSALVQTGKNWMTDSQSVWGKVLLAGPPGVNAATWAKVLQNTAVGANYGDFVQDDGAYNGLSAGFAGIDNKGGSNPRDYRFNTANNGSNNPTPAKFAVGSSATIFNPTAAEVAATLTTNPPATGLTTSTDLAAASTAALAIEQSLEAVNPISTKKGGANLLNSAGCGFNNNPPTATSTYGTNNYVPTNISDITTLAPAISATTMTNLNQSVIAAAYQSAKGFNGGVIVSNPNCDYHNNGGTPQGTANQDVINASAVVAMLAGFAAAKQPGAILINSNGSVSCGGSGSATVSINGTNTTVTGVQAEGDNGGTFSQGLLLFYSPTGTLPTPAVNGTINTTTGATQKGVAGSPANSMIGLMASALYFLNNGNIPQAFITASGATAQQFTPWMVVG